MTPRRRSSATTIPIMMTFFAIALGVAIAVIGGREPFLLYFITPPFPIVLLWLARGVGEEPRPVHRQAS